MNETSTWTALGNPAFRKLWFATMISGTCVAAHDNTATWMMNVFTESPFLISLISALASLPFFLFTLPAGALADKVDGQTLLLVLVYLFIAFVRQTEWFFVVAALAGAGWTISASELWLASQRATPSRGRSRMNAMIIMISQEAMAIGGVSIQFAGSLEERPPHDLPVGAEPNEVAPTAGTTELLAA